MTISVGEPIPAVESRIGQKDPLAEHDLAAIAESVARRLHELSLVGRDPAGGWSRPGLSGAERQAHEVFASWAMNEGYGLQQDGLGSSFARARGEGPEIVIGSHLDTVPRGGSFDGAAGVVAAFEAAGVLRERDLRLPITIVAFACEEGARFGVPCLGSQVACGQLSSRRLAEIRDADGVSALEAAQALGLPTGDINTPTWTSGSIACFLELHIEQGRVLEELGYQIGVVDVIAGSTRLELTIKGRSDHSGATPMHLRRDALAGAAEIISFVERAARKARTAVATVGRLSVSPNALTTVPGEVTLAVDIRDVDSTRQRELAGAARQYARYVAADRGLDCSVRLLHDRSPGILHHWVRALITETCDGASVPYRVMRSGAAHDAVIMSEVAPTGMLLVPSRAGLSHAADEWSDVQDIALGAIILARTAAEIGAKLGSP